jgi:hypothetical protein
MSKTLLYPLRFEPIYQYRLWGGRRLADLLTAPLPDEGPFGEAWVLSDRKDRQSRVTDGPLKGRTIAQLLEQSPEQLLGEGPQPFDRFPLRASNRWPWTTSNRIRSACLTFITGWRLRYRRGSGSKSAAGLRLSSHDTGG